MLWYVLPLSSYRLGRGQEPAHQKRESRPDISEPIPLEDLIAEQYANVESPNQIRRYLRVLTRHDAWKSIVEPEDQEDLEPGYPV